MPRPSAEIREQAPGCQIEVLIPDFQGREDCLQVVIDAKPEVLNHNTETVPRLYRAVRSGARYERTLDLLSNVKRFAPSMVSKTGVMVGIGETTDELLEVFRDLAARKVDILTVGQYLRPSKDHLPMARYYTPDEFAYMKTRRSRWASAMWSPARWCARRITRMNRRRAPGSFLSLRSIPLSPPGRII